MSHVTAVETYDVRFPTSHHLDGSDAMNPEPDYSAAYLRLGTDAADGHEGHGFVFTTGRGNDIQLAAVRAVAQDLLHHWPPTAPGAGTQLLAASLRDYEHGSGKYAA